MTRPTDWSPLCGGDPIPGDPGAIDVEASKLRNTGTAIREAQTNLQRLQFDSRNTGKGIQKIIEDIQLVRQGLAKIESRVSGAADVLGAYHPELRDCQTKSLKLLEEAQNARAAANSAAEKQQYYANMSRQAAGNGASDAEVDDLVRQANAANSQVKTYNQVKLPELRRRLQTIIDERDDAAKTAITDLKHFDETSAIKDNLIDKVIDWWENSPLAQTIIKAIDTIMDIIDKLSIVLGIISVILIALGPLTAGVTAIIGTVIAGITLLPSLWSTIKAGCNFGVTAYKCANGFTTFDKVSDAFVDFTTEGLIFGASAVITFLPGGGVASTVGKTVAKTFLVEGIKTGIVTVLQTDAVKNLVRDGVEFQMKNPVPFYVPTWVAPTWPVLPAPFIAKQIAEQYSKWRRSVPNRYFDKQCCCEQ
ncbi:MAG: hypothetical protein LBR20_03420 [Propionibacteriaceae bacterium]|jgi:hypothetical protein|nr:hypothetical protein [Propionibacteriaceae bacterium]